MSRTRRKTFAPKTVQLPKFEGNTPSSPLRKRGALVVLQGQEADIGRHVWVDGAITLGRDPAIELPLADELISRRHCRVTHENGAFFVEDLASKNGTRLNGAPLEGRAPLNAGDRIFLGAVVVKFTLSLEEVAYHEQMDARVGKDDLTGLVARRRFDVAFERALEQSRLLRMPLAVMMLDLDGLKQINDQHGHPVGAATIAAVGKIIGEVVSPHGAACRLGGDEFAAFLRGLTKTVAVDFGESIRGWVATHKFASDVKPTISIGVAAYPVDGKTALELLDRADAALYRAKRAGRDRVQT